MLELEQVNMAKATKTIMIKLATMKCQLVSRRELTDESSNKVVLSLRAYAAVSGSETSTQQFS